MNLKTGYNLQYVSKAIAFGLNAIVLVHKM